MIMRDLHDDLFTDTLAVSPCTNFLTLSLGVLLLISAHPSTATASGFLFASMKDDQKILTFRQHPDTGDLTRVSEILTDAEPGFLAANKNGTRLFAAYRSSGALASFQIDTSSGTLSLISTVEGGADPAYVGLDQTESFLFSAYYQAGKVGIHRLGTNGELNSHEPRWYSTNLKAHAIQIDPSNRWALVPHTGPNAIYLFSFDRDQGSFLPSAPPLVYTGTLTGPRHLQFHPNKNIVYVDNEQGSSVTVFQFDPEIGQIQPIQTLSTLPDSYTGRNSCADLELSPKGRYLYASNRGHNSIAAFRTDPKTGKLTRIEVIPTEPIPRALDVSPSGKWLVAAGQDSGHLQSYQIHLETGQLAPHQKIQVGPSPWALLSVAPRVP